MISPSRTSTIPLVAFFALATLVVPVATGFSQNAGAAGQTFYLRVANLLPLGSERLEIRSGNETYFTGLKPGFFSGYSPLDDAAKRGLKVFAGKNPIGEARFRSDRAEAFFTLAVIRSGGKDTVTLCADDEFPKPAEGEPSPKRWLRLYLGAFGHPYEIDLGTPEKLSVQEEGVSRWIPYFSDLPESISITYVSRDGGPVTVHFPVDPAAFSSSVFVSQRGAKRPRLRVAADSLKPEEETVGGDAPSTAGEGEAENLPPAP